MELLVLPKMEDIYEKERAVDELPQSGSGRTIMTAEPKFVPENAAEINLGGQGYCRVRLVDSVGFMVAGASGNMEDGKERMVMTPWYDQEIPMSKAAEEGTYRVISDHSTIGILITTDGSICGIHRDDYVAAEEKTAQALEKAGRPYVILLNCADPESETAVNLAKEIAARFGHTCLPLNCARLTEADIAMIIKTVLDEFPVQRYKIFLPAWIEALNDENELRNSLFSSIKAYAEQTANLGCACDLSAIENSELFENTHIDMIDHGKGEICVSASVPQALYYETISRESGFMIRNDAELMHLLHSICGLKEEYDRVHEALADVRTKGYGIVMPTAEEMQLEEPQIVRQGGRYGVRLKATAPSNHMVMTNVETEVSPAVGGEKASDEVISFLLQGYDGDMSRIWESNIYGKSLNDIAGEGLTNKIRAVTEDTQDKLRVTVQRIVNEGCNGLICIIL